jgi:hypothetical protein
MRGVTATLGAVLCKLGIALNHKRVRVASLNSMSFQYFIARIFEQVAVYEATAITDTSFNCKYTVHLSHFNERAIQHSTAFMMLTLLIDAVCICTETYVQQFSRQALACEHRSCAHTVAQLASPTMLANSVLQLLAAPAARALE